MPLVEYGSGSESEEEGKQVGPTKAGQRKSFVATLPPPVNANNLSALDQLKPTIKEAATGPKQILIAAPVKPDLSDDEDKCVAERKRRKTNSQSKGSSLTSMLPSPKSQQISVTSNTGLMPHSLQKKTVAAPRRQQIIIRDNEPGSSDDEEMAFLQGLKVPAQTSISSVPVDSASQHACIDAEDDGIVGPSLPPDPIVVGDLEAHDDVIGLYPGDDTEGQLDMPAEAIFSLEGKKNRNRGVKDVQIMEINAAEQVGSTALWHQQYSHLQPKAPAVSQRELKAEKNSKGLAKRKHQITFLAAQAKMQEQELEQKWSNNRFSKKQTQAKYGF